MALGIQALETDSTITLPGNSATDGCFCCLHIVDRQHSVPKTCAGIPPPPKGGCIKLVNANPLCGGGFSVSSPFMLKGISGATTGYEAA